MTISNPGPASLLESAIHAQAVQSEFGMAVLDKAQDVTRQQGEAMVELIEAAAPAEAPIRGLDVYA